MTPRLPSPVAAALAAARDLRRYPTVTVWWYHEETSCPACGAEIEVGDRPVTDALHRRTWLACGPVCADQLRRLEP